MMSFCSGREIVVWCVCEMIDWILRLMMKDGMIRLGAGLGNKSEIVVLIVGGVSR
jgi:hypothetical protein